jgi:hypothetical protein
MATYKKPLRNQAIRSSGNYRNKSNYRSSRDKTYENRKYEKRPQVNAIQKRSRALIYEYNPDTKTIKYITAVPLYKYNEFYIGELGLLITGVKETEQPPILAYYGYLSCRKLNDGTLEVYIFNNLVTTQLNPSKIAPDFFEANPFVISASATTLPLWSNRLVKIH